MAPQFNRENLKQLLQESGIAYVFLGKELGARSDDPSCYDRGKIQFDRLARSKSFMEGINRVKEGMKNYRVALMCAEKEPLTCHRAILVSRYIEAEGIEVEHILADGVIVPHKDLLIKLLHQFHLKADLFRSHKDVIEEAYKMQGERIAYDTGEMTITDRELG